jgi:hypothetical protein
LTEPQEWAVVGVQALSQLYPISVKQSLAWEDWQFPSCLGSSKSAQVWQSCTPNAGMSSTWEDWGFGAYDAFLRGVSEVWVENCPQHL